MSGHVRKIKDGRALPWLVTYYDDEGKRRFHSERRKLDADNFLADKQVKVLKGEFVDPRAGRIRFKQYADQWLTSHPVRPSTHKLYVGYIGHMRELHDVALGDLRASTMRTWQAALYGRLSPSTAETIRGVCSTILNAAIVDKLIARSPLEGVPRGPKVTQSLVTPMPYLQVVEWRDLITPKLSAAVLLGAGCGPRRGEAMGLTEDRVDFLRRKLVIDRQLLAVRNGRPVFGPPKTPASVREIPIPQTVVDALAAHLATYGAGVDGLIFTAPRGGPVNRTMVGSAIRDAQIRRWAIAHGHQLVNGWRIPAWVEQRWKDAHPAGNTARFHDLRHFYASRLIQAGESVKTVQHRLGHASAVETLNTYAHLWPDNEDRTRDAIDSLFAEPPREQRESNEA